MIADKFDGKYIDELREDVTNFLFNLMKIRSYPNEEVEACEYAYNEFSKINGVIVRKLPIDNTIKEHPLWCSGPTGKNDYTGHFNIEVVWEGTKEQDPIYLNAHIDTVTASEEYLNLLDPVIDGDIIHGLGACDDKGSIASIYAVFKMLSKKNIKLPFDVVGHIVVEEEIGGNGALAATDRPLKGQAAIVLEPSSGMIWPVARCGLWIKITCHGVACHTAAMNPDMGIAALDLSFKAIAKLKEVYSQYIEEYKQNPMKEYEGYIPMLNVGQLHCGDWPAKVPNKAVIMASVPVMPTSSNKAMKERIAKAFAEDEDLRTKTEIEYVFDRESSVLSFDHPLVTELAKCVKANGYSGKVACMRALCDKYFYQEIHGIPAVSFGPGDLNDAHSATEKISITDVLNAANAIHDYISMKA
jgi:acetylornithine deacetylase